MIPHFFDKCKFYLKGCKHFFLFAFFLGTMRITYRGTRVKGVAGVPARGLPQVATLDTRTTTHKLVPRQKKRQTKRKNILFFLAGGGDSIYKYQVVRSFYRPAPISRGGTGCFTLPPKAEIAR